MVRYHHTWVPYHLEDTSSCKIDSGMPWLCVSFTPFDVGLKKCLYPFSNPKFWSGCHWLDLQNPKVWEASRELQKQPPCTLTTNHHSLLHDSCVFEAGWCSIFFACSIHWQHKNMQILTNYLVPLRFGLSMRPRPGPERITFMRRACAWPMLPLFTVVEFDVPPSLPDPDCWPLPCSETDQLVSRILLPLLPPNSFPISSWIHYSHFLYHCDSLLLPLFVGSALGKRQCIKFLLKLDPMFEWHLEYYVCIWWRDMFHRTACI